MVVDQSRPKRKPTGGRYKSYRKLKQYELGSLPTHSKLGTVRKKTVRVTGGNVKYRILSTDIANLFDPKTKSYSQAKIRTISGNPANRHFIRRNIMTKGSIIETEQGKARVTSRPGQDGIVNAVLIS